jgi:diguanylate cyclase (GGDEF)-like protein
MLLIDANGVVSWGNRVARQRFGPERLRGRDFSQLFTDSASAAEFLAAVRAEGPDSGQGWRTAFRHPDGRTRELFVEASVTSVFHGGVLVTVTEPDLGMLGTDPLTGCLNRRALDWELLDRQGSGSLVLLDIDRLKPVNDEHGHDAGDRVLRAVSSRLIDHIDGHGTVFRLGGDEFAVVLDTTDRGEAKELMERFRQVLLQPIEVASGVEVRMTAAMGVSTLTAKSPLKAVRQADGALFYAKAHPGMGVAVSGEVPGWAQDRTTLVATVEDLERDRVRLEVLARTDALTELPNRLALNEESQRLAATARRSGRTYSALFADIDHFSQYNKFYGDAAGDNALIEVGRVMQAQCRAEDVVYRKGGEEFVVLLPDTELDQAVVIAERLRAAIFERGIPYETRSDGLSVLTVVVGVAEHADTDTGPEVTWERAAAPIMALKQRHDAPRNQVLHDAQVSE